MISDLDLCRASALAYSKAPTLAVGDVHAVLTPMDGHTVVAFRGTVPTSWQDWFRDADAFPTPVADHPRLGLCHRGFVTGAESILPLLRPSLSAPYILTGHSLGGALAIATAALLTDIGFPPARLVTFGAPRVGIGSALATILKDVTMTLYRDGDDPVPEVPIYPFRHPCALTAIGVPLIDPIEAHSIARYSALIAA